MPRLLWWAHTVIGLSLASPFLAYAGWTLLDGDYLLGFGLLAIGILAFLSPQYLYRRFKARQLAALSKARNRLPIPSRGTDDGTDDT